MMINALRIANCFSKSAALCSALTSNLSISNSNVSPNTPSFRLRSSQLTNSQLKLPPHSTLPPRNEILLFLWFFRESTLILPSSVLRLCFAFSPFNPAIFLPCVPNGFPKWRMSIRCPLWRAVLEKEAIIAPVSKPANQVFTYMSSNWYASRRILPNDSPCAAAPAASPVCLNRYRLVPFRCRLRAHRTWRHPISSLHFTLFAIYLPSLIHSLIPSPNPTPQLAAIYRCLIGWKHF